MEEADAPPLQNVVVAVRSRPLLAGELGRRTCIRVPNAQHIEVGMQQRRGAKKAFRFDQTFDTESTQEAVYSWVEPMVLGCFDGYNMSVLAYGQTGSGKTYTMGTGDLAAMGEAQRGIIPRLFDQIWSEIDRRREHGATFWVRCSYVEVHDDVVKDLLSDPDEREEVIMREDRNGAICLTGVRDEEVADGAGALRCLQRGGLSRTTAATRMNSASSRSHAVFSLTIGQRRPNPSTNAEEFITAKMQLVDLAGSERNKRSQTVGKHFKESVHINQGLLALANVINVLSDPSGAGGGRLHVPYRDHKLTRLLQNSLGGNSRTFMLACVSPNENDLQESLNTLRYAARARNITNTPVVNHGNDDIESLQREVELLRSELASGKPGLGIAAPVSPGQLAAALAMVARLQAELQSARAQSSGDSAEVSAATSSEVELLRQQVNAAEGKLSDSREQLSKDEQIFAAISNEVEELMLRNQKLQAEVTELKSSRAAGVDAPGTDLEQEEQALIASRIEVQQMEQGNSEAATSYESQQRQFATQISQMEEEMRDKETLIAQLETDRQRREKATEKFTAELTKLRDAVTAKEAELARMKRAQEKSKRSREEQKQITAKHKQMTAELDELRRRVDEQERLATERKAADVRMRMLAKDLIRMRAERDAVQQRVRTVTQTHVAAERRRVTDMLKLRQQGERRAQAIRQLQATVKQQNEISHQQQATLAQAHKQLRDSTEKSNLGATGVHHLASTLLNEVERRLQNSEAAQQAADAKARLRTLDTERGTVSAQLRKLELRERRGQTLGREEAQSLRELTERKEDLETEQAYLEDAVQQSADERPGGRRSGSEKNMQALEQASKLSPSDSTTLVTFLLGSLGKAMNAERRAGTVIQQMDAAISKSQIEAEEATQQVKMAEAEYTRRLHEARKQADSKLERLLEMQSGDSTPSATAATQPGSGQELSKMLQIKDDQLEILTEHNAVYKRRIRELSQRLARMHGVTVASGGGLTPPPAAHFGAQPGSRSPTPDSESGVGDRESARRRREQEVKALREQRGTTDAQRALERDLASARDELARVQAYGGQMAAKRRESSRSMAAEGEAPLSSRSSRSQVPKRNPKDIFEERAMRKGWDDHTGVDGAAWAGHGQGGEAPGGPRTPRRRDAQCAAFTAEQPEGAFMSHEEHHRRKHDRKIRLQRMRDDSKKEWRSPASDNARQRTTHSVA